MRSVIGQRAVREQLTDILTDESRHTEGTPEKVFFPETEADILFALDAARKEGRSVTLVGGKTGIAGGSVPGDGCVALCFSSMNKILRVQPGSSGALLLECEPGITLREIGRFLEDPRGWPGPAPAGELPAGRQFFYPPDPTETDAELGGTVATNASGARSFYFGATRAHVEAVSIILASGETATIRRGCCARKNLTLRTDQGTSFEIPLPDVKLRRVKNAAGYYIRPDMDLIDLLIGSEGTLAIFSSIMIRARIAPGFLSGLSFFPSRTDAFEFADFLRNERHVAAIEYFDTSALSLLTVHRDQITQELPDFPPNAVTAVLWEFFEDDDAMFDDRLKQWEATLSQCGSSFDATWAGFDEAGRERLRVFRHAVPEIVNNIISRCKSSVPSIRKISTDAAVPIDSFRMVFDRQIALIEQTGVHYAIFGHLGDGHLHINFMPRDEGEMAKALGTYEQLMAIVIENDGTISAEHGIGKLKKKYLLKMYGDEAICGMKQIKRILDPNGILSPGNLFDL